MSPLGCSRSISGVRGSLPAGPAPAVSMAQVSGLDSTMVSKARGMSRASFPGRRVTAPRGAAGALSARLPDGLGDDARALVAALRRLVAVGEADELLAASVEEE